MKASEIFTPISRYQLDHGRKDTNRAIAAAVGLTEHRIAQLKEHPELMKIMELEALEREFHFTWRIG